MNILKKGIGHFLISLLTGDGMQFVRHPLNRNDRIGMLNKCWGYIFTNQVKGAYYEFGIHGGESFINSWKAYQILRRWRKAQEASTEEWRRKSVGDYASYNHDFYGFDTFEGMPKNNEKSITFAPGTFISSLEEVDNRCTKAGMKFKLFKGLFAEINDDILRGLPPAAIINIDSDLYTSANDALKKIKDKFQQGTILLMDDYNCFNADNNKGERRALKEFSEKNKYIDFESWFSYQYVGQAFICHIL